MQKPSIPSSKSFQKSQYNNVTYAVHCKYDITSKEDCTVSEVKAHTYSRKGGNYKYVSNPRTSFILILYNIEMQFVRMNMTHDRRHLTDTFYDSLETYVTVTYKNEYYTYLRPSFFVPNLLSVL